MGDGWRTRSTFTFRPLVATNVTCSASNEAVIEPRVSGVLEVRVRGRPRVEVKVDQDVVREGDSFEVLCKSSAYPQDVGYRWFFGGAELEGMTDNALLIEEISRMYDQATCSTLPSPSSTPSAPSSSSCPACTSCMFEASPWEIPLAGVSGSLAPT